MKILSGIFKWTQLALASTAIVEQTMAGAAGADKSTQALAIINNEAPVLGAVLPNIPGLPQAIINMAVAGFNLAGLFQHKSSSSGNAAIGAATPAPSK